MQACGRLIEDEEIAEPGDCSGRRPGGFGSVCRRDSGLYSCALRSIRQMRNKFEPLRFAAAQCIQRLPQFYITKPHFLQHVERLGESLRFADSFEELDCL